MLNEIINDVEVGMQKSLDSYKIELGKLRTGRASTSLVEGVKADYYGNETALQHIASLSVGDARTILVTPWEKNMIKPIEKAIGNAGLGLNPISDANLVRVPIPPLTEERRKEMVKTVKSITENARVSVRSVRREAMDRLKDMLKNKEIDEDEDRRTQEGVQKTTDKFISDIDKVMVDKEAELMQV